MLGLGKSSLSFLPSFLLFCFFFSFPYAMNLSFLFHLNSWPSSLQQKMPQTPPGNFFVALFCSLKHVFLKCLISQPLNMSRMKRKADAQPKDKVILVENGNSDCNSDEPVANSLKRRWVWNRFE
jgi:hypothetical protein